MSGVQLPASAANSFLPPKGAKTKLPNKVDRVTIIGYIIYMKRITMDVGSSPEP
jgi:hypothetical protein